MKIKDLQKRLDYLIEQVKENPNHSLYYRILSVSGFTMNFEYYYNGTYSISQVKIRFYAHLNTRNAWYEHVPKNIGSIDARILYLDFIDFVFEQLYMFQDEIVSQLRSDAVELNRSEIK